jgi:hypothetical protein
MVRTRMPEVGGILSIIAGGVSFLGALFLLFLFIVYYATIGAVGPEFPVSAVGTAIFAPFFIVCIVAIVGGVFALKRRLWGFALAGAICSVLTLFTWPLGVASIVLLVFSRREFDRLAQPSSPPG